VNKTPTGGGGGHLGNLAICPQQDEFRAKLFLDSHVSVPHSLCRKYPMIFITHGQVIHVIINITGKPGPDGNIGKLN
jgi:hypothetical protein